MYIRPKTHTIAVSDRVAANIAQGKPPLKVFFLASPLYEPIRTESVDLVHSEKKILSAECEYSQKFSIKLTSKGLQVSLAYRVINETETATLLKDCGYLEDEITESRQINDALEEFFLDLTGGNKGKVEGFLVELNY